MKKSSWAIERDRAEHRHDRPAVRVAAVRVRPGGGRVRRSGGRSVSGCPGRGARTRCGSRCRAAGRRAAGFAVTGHLRAGSVENHGLAFLSSRRSSHRRLTAFASGQRNNAILRRRTKCSGRSVERMEPATTQGTPAAEPATGDTDIAAVGALVADPGRCRMLLALDDGRALPPAGSRRRPGSARHRLRHLRWLTGAGLLASNPTAATATTGWPDPRSAELIEALQQLAPAARSARCARAAAPRRCARPVPATTTWPAGSASSSCPR